MPRYQKVEYPGEKQHEWAKGCASCSYGMVIAPDILKHLTVAEGRAMQMDCDMIVFCECKAGHMQRQYLRKVLSNMEMQRRQVLYDYVMRVSVPTMGVMG